jgi:hypothetical protein
MPPGHHTDPCAEGRAPRWLRHPDSRPEDLKDILTAADAAVRFARGNHSPSTHSLSVTFDGPASVDLSVASLLLGTTEPGLIRRLCRTTCCHWTLLDRSSSGHRGDTQQRRFPGTPSVPLTKGHVAWDASAFRRRRHHSRAGLLQQRTSDRASIAARTGATRKAARRGLRQISTNNPTCGLLLTSPLPPST